METATNHRIVSAEQLRQSGFSAEQIARLEDLRANYPLIELVRSQQELNELAFVRWRYRRGLLQS